MLHELLIVGLGFDFDHGQGDVLECGVFIRDIEEGKDDDGDEVLSRSVQRFSRVVLGDIHFTLEDAHHDVKDGSSEDPRPVVRFGYHIDNAQVVRDIPQSLHAEVPAKAFPEFLANERQEALGVQVALGSSDECFTHVEMVEDSENGGEVSEGLMQRVRLSLPRWTQEAGFQRVQNGMPCLVGNNVQ